MRVRPLEFRQEATPSSLAHVEFVLINLKGVQDKQTPFPQPIGLLVSLKTATGFLLATTPSQWEHAEERLRHVQQAGLPVTFPAVTRPTGGWREGSPILAPQRAFSPLPHLWFVSVFGILSLFKCRSTPLHPGYTLASALFCCSLSELSTLVLPSFLPPHLS